MEVVIALAESDQGSDDVITRRIAVIEWLVPEPVSQRVDAKGGLLDEEYAEDTSVDEATNPVTPCETSDDSGQDETHEDDDLEVVLVLPDDHRIFVEVRDVRTSYSLWVLLHNHPSKMRV